MFIVILSLPSSKSLEHDRIQVSAVLSLVLTSALTQSITTPPPPPSQMTSFRFSNISFISISIPPLRFHFFKDIGGLTQINGWQNKRNNYLNNLWFCEARCRERSSSVESVSGSSLSFKSEDKSNGSRFQCFRFCWNIVSLLAADRVKICDARLKWTFWMIFWFHSVHVRKIFPFFNISIC